MVTCCNDNLEDDILQPSADKIVCMPKIIHHVAALAAVPSESSFVLHDILATDGSVVLYTIYDGHSLSGLWSRLLRL